MNSKETSNQHKNVIDKLHNMQWLKRVPRPSSDQENRLLSKDNPFKRDYQRWQRTVLNVRRLTENIETDWEKELTVSSLKTELIQKLYETEILSLASQESLMLAQEKSLTGNVSDSNTKHSEMNKNVKSKTNSKSETNMANSSSVAVNIDQVMNDHNNDETLDLPVQIALEKSIVLAQQQKSEMEMIEAALEDSLKLDQDETSQPKVIHSRKEQIPEPTRVLVVKTTQNTRVKSIAPSTSPSSKNNKNETDATITIEKNTNKPTTNPSTNKTKKSDKIQETVKTDDPKPPAKPDNFRKNKPYNPSVKFAENQSKDPNVDITKTSVPKKTEEPTKVPSPNYTQPPGKDTGLLPKKSDEQPKVPPLNFTQPPYPGKDMGLFRNDKPRSNYQDPNTRKTYNNRTFVMNERGGGHPRGGLDRNRSYNNFPNRNFCPMYPFNPRERVGSSNYNMNYRPKEPSMKNYPNQYGNMQGMRRNNYRTNDQTHKPVVEKPNDTIKPTNSNSDFTKSKPQILKHVEEPTKEIQQTFQSIAVPQLSNQVQSQVSTVMHQEQPVDVQSLNIDATQNQHYTNNDIEQFLTTDTSNVQQELNVHQSSGTSDGTIHYYEGYINQHEGQHVDNTSLQTTQNILPSNNHITGDIIPNYIHPQSHVSIAPNFLMPPPGFYNTNNMLIPHPYNQNVSYMSTSSLNNALPINSQMYNMDTVNRGNVNVEPRNFQTVYVVPSVNGNPPTIHYTIPYLQNSQQSHLGGEVHQESHPNSGNVQDQVCHPSFFSIPPPNYPNNNTITTNNYQHQFDPNAGAFVPASEYQRYTHEPQHVIQSEQQHIQQTSNQKQCMSTTDYQLPLDSFSHPPPQQSYPKFTHSRRHNVTIDNVIPPMISPLQVLHGMSFPNNPNNRTNHTNMRYPTNIQNDNSNAFGGNLSMNPESSRGGNQYSVGRGKFAYNK